MDVRKLRKLQEELKDAKERGCIIIIWDKFEDKKKTFRHNEFRVTDTWFVFRDGQGWTHRQWSHIELRETKEGYFDYGRGQ